MNWKFVTKPKWLLGHTIIVSVVALFLFLSLWQFDRLDERRALNDAVRAQLDTSALELTSSDTAALADYRHVKLKGSWDSSHSVYVRYPIVNGIQGYYVLMPFVLGDGSAFVVNRGFIPIEEGKNAAAVSVPLSQKEEIEGYLIDPPKRQASIDKTDGNPGVPTVEAIDIQELRVLMSQDRLADKYIQLSAASGVVNGMTPVALPELNDGPHFSYALQWIGFAVVAIGGWGAVLYRTAKDLG